MSAREDLLRPLPGPNPGGASLHYDPLYDKVKEARREDEDIPQGEWTRQRKLADWPLVTKLVSDALATKSKDLQLAAWLTESLARQEGLGGLRDGLNLLGGLLERHWDHLYPELEDGDSGLRAAPLEWVGRYLQGAVRSIPLNKNGHDWFTYKAARAVGYEADAAGDEKKMAARRAALADKKVAPEEFDKAFDATPKTWYRQLVADLDGCVEAVKVLDTVGQERFGDAAPSYTELEIALEAVSDVARPLLAKKLELDPDPPGAVTPGATTSEASAGREGGVGASASISPEPTSAEDATARIASAARFLRRADPRNPASYLLLRGFRWGELRARAGRLDPKLLSAPPTHVRTHLKSLLLDGNWSELLDAVEEVMATPHGRGWLDLQRYGLTACAQLGSEYECVDTSVRAALVALLRDVPDLADLTLMDDTPTANAETRTWLQAGGLLAAAAEAPSLPQPAAAPEPRPREGRAAFKRAMEEVRAGRPQRGIELLMGEADQEKSARARFLRRSEAASIMVEAGLGAVAIPILKELIDQIESHKLEDWEAGDAVARPMGLMYRCLQKLGGDAELKESLYQRICRLDPLQAIAFPSGNGGNDGAVGT